MKIRMNGTFGLSGIVSRALLSLFVVFATYNPSGRSYYHWALASGPWLPRVLLGLVLLGVYLVLLWETWDVVGFAGSALVVVLCAATAWMLHQSELIDLGEPTTLKLAVMFTVAVTMTAGMCYSLLTARLTGVLHTRTTLT